MNTRFLVDNMFNELQNPAHVIAASEEDTNREAWHVANGRRSSADFWQGTTAAADQWVRVNCGSSKEADTLFVDRGHNLEGKAVKLQKSTDNFAANTVDVFSATIPSSASAGTALSATNGAYTEEGAWGRAFTADSSQYWRLFVPGVASFVPRLVGLWLGKGWEPLSPLQLPVITEETEVGYQGDQSDYGWRSPGTPWNRGGGEIVIELDPSDETAARSFWSEFRRPRPAWLVHDTTKAERAVLATPPPGRGGLSRTTEWFWPTLRFQWEEHQPKVL